jgi:hypothetical protein
MPFRRRQRAQPANPNPNPFDQELTARRSAAESEVAKEVQAAAGRSADCPTIAEVLPPEDVTLLDSFWASNTARSLCKEARRNGACIRWTQYFVQGNHLWSGWTVEIGGVDDGGVSPRYGTVAVAAADRSIRDSHGAPLERSESVVYGWVKSNGPDYGSEWVASDLLGALDHATAAAQRV